MTPPRPCPGCTLDHTGTEALCGDCWTGIPGRHRAAVRAAQKDLGYNPASPRLQRLLDIAIVNAVAAKR